MKNGGQKEARALDIAFTLGYTIVLPLIGGVLLGIWLDGKFKSSPILLLASVLMSIFLPTALLVVRVKKDLE